MDTVHQGDWDGNKDVYHINAVDTVTQWQVVGCTSKISEQYLIPVLEAMLPQFPFRILGFHADNGSEFINRLSGAATRSLIGRKVEEGKDWMKGKAAAAQDYVRGHGEELRDRVKEVPEVIGRDRTKARGSARLRE